MFGLQASSLRCSGGGAGKGRRACNNFRWKISVKWYWCFLAPKTGTGLSCTIYKIPVNFSLSLDLKPGTGNPNYGAENLGRFGKNGKKVIPWKVLLFLRKISTGMNPSIWILPGISGFSIQMVSALRLWNLNICVDAKCSLAETTLVMTSLPLARVFQFLFTISRSFPLRTDWRKSDSSVDGEPRGNWRWSSNSKLSFLFPPDSLCSYSLTKVKVHPFFLFTSNKCFFFLKWLIILFFAFIVKYLRNAQ